MLLNRKNYRSGHCSDFSRVLMGTTVGFLLLFTSGCVSSKAPQGWLADPNELASDVRGGWIEINASKQDADPSAQRMGDFMGELLAVDEDTLFVLAAGSLQRVGLSQIERARLFTYNAHTGAFQLGAALGFLSTPSHGFFLIISAPVWIIAGSSIAGARSRQPLIQYKGQRDVFDAMRPYSRFPQGMPGRVEEQLRAGGQTGR